MEEDEIMDVSISDDTGESEAGGGNGDSLKSEAEAGPDAQTKAQEEVEGSATITFTPPAYIQRYCKVRDELEKLMESPKYKEMYASVGKTVMEVGCAEFGMLSHLKNMVDVGRIIFLDLDRKLLEESAFKLRPFPAEYLQRMSRPQPLVVEAYSGCVTKVDVDLFRKHPDIWAVIGIEIVEHLHPEVLRGFEETVFGIVSPHIVIVTTPNSEFNEVFNLPPGKFRHWDHKFEWSRQEFESWCKKIVGEFQTYIYRIEGICEGPEDTKHLGCVSQMAIFEKGTATQIIPSTSYSSRLQSGAYSLVESQEYPNYIETRTPEEITLNEFNYFVNSYLFTTTMLIEYDEQELKEVVVPFKKIQSLSRMPEIVETNPEFLRNVLQTTPYEIRSINGEMNVVINIEEYVKANLDGSDSEEEMQYLSEDLKDLNVNRVIAVDEECWD